MSDLSALQQRILDALPGSKYDLAEKTDTTPQGAASAIKRMRRKGYEIPFDRSTGKYHRNGQTPYQDASNISYNKLKEQLQEGTHLSELTEQFNTVENEIVKCFEGLQDNGVQIESRGNTDDPVYYIPDEIDKSYTVSQDGQTIEIALISDTHLGSSAEHLEELHDFYDKCEQRGITDVFHCGDISDGFKVYQGHLNELKDSAIGWGRLRDYVVENYPQRDGITTHFIEGNHDNKYFNRNSIHFGRLIANERPDLHYLGNSQATVYLDESREIDLELIHPSGGKPYTTGYRLQTLYRERNMSDRPTIAGVGHLHGSMYAETEGVMGLYAGAWKGTTTYGKRKGHQAKIGGWILEITIENKRVSEFVPHWIGYEEKESENEFSL
jgi:biotin operon repressor